MNVKLEHAFIIDKKISSFARAVVEIFKFFFNEVTFAPLCILFFPICEKVKFFFAEINSDT